MPEVLPPATTIPPTSSAPPPSSTIPQTSSEPSSHPVTPPTGNAFSTVNQAEIDHFSRLSSQWWNEKGEFGLLHKMNPTRMEFVRQNVVQGLQDDEGWSFEKRDRVDEAGNLKSWEGMASVKGKGKWLEGMDVLDVGCGGGLLSEASLPLSPTSIKLTAISLRVSQESEATFSALTHHHTISPSQAFTHRRIHSCRSTRTRR